MSDKLERVVALANLMQQQQAEVARLELLLKTATDNLRRTEQEDLPDLMAEIGLSEIKLADGSTVQVSAEVHCAITEERRRDAHSWLIDNGFGGLIKTEVAVAFGRGEREQADALVAQIREHFPEHEAASKEAVHPSTLKSFVKEQMELGKAIPFDLFGIRPYNKAKIKYDRSKRK